MQVDVLFSQWLPLIFVQECVGLFTWKIIPRMTDVGITAIPAKTGTHHTASSCALRCEMRTTCKLFRINKLTSECDLHDGGGYKASAFVQGNQFYQKVPDSAKCVANRDEWFPEYHACVWIHTVGLTHQEANAACLSAGKVMMGAKDKTQIESLMNLINTKWIHVYSNRVGVKMYTWLDGSAISLTGWWCGGQPYEDLACLGVDLGLGSLCPNGGLDDIACTDKRRFFCI